MNEHVRIGSELRSAKLPPTTQAAEGMERRRFSVAEIEAMVEAGVILEDERFELIGGEVVPMSPKGNRHDLLKSRLNRYWGKCCPDHLDYTQETTFRLTEDTFLEPDFVFYRMVDELPNLKPQTCLLAVEVADTSLGYDLGRKARLYASFGIRELWVIDAMKLVTHVHRRPGIEGYQDIRVVSSDDNLEPEFARELAVKLRALKLD
jgi:Uma2 family endonuclease